ncbi:thymocyte nuclear protein 1 [Thelonectria olida]|uniref:Thymocyte nuclear protein 1 n=1 Tax=Thelonectria olida TaxID=1576542 RepID=A0A9P9ARG9_9HYPO|nr:thymocyte nuclear protein 1 [Thelonectria olida]
MPPRKRNALAADVSAPDEPLPKRRSLRSATRSHQAASIEPPPAAEPVSKPRRSVKRAAEPETESKKVAESPSPKVKATKSAAKKSFSKAETKADKEEKASRLSEDTDVASVPTHNPDAPRHEGEWYWLMKAEPETRLENGIDVRFSIDDLRAKTEPEGWDGIRAYAARNHMRNMNAGDKAFFYHSNCKEPGIVGVMEIVKEFSEDRTARQPGTPYYDPSSTKEKPKWDLVHVEFRKKFAVKIGLKELRELGKPGGPLENMMMLKQSRLSVSRVSGDEWKALCEIADEKAREAGLEHET